MYREHIWQLTFKNVYLIAHCDCTPEISNSAVVIENVPMVKSGFDNKLLKLCFLTRCDCTEISNAAVVMKTNRVNLTINLKIVYLSQAVIDILSREFRECITPALMNHNQFSNFLHQCCALAWRMCIAAPPLYLVSSINDSDTTVDRKLHDISTVNIERTVNQIDYYLWPALFTKKNGIVLIRGTIVLQKA